MTNATTSIIESLNEILAPMDAKVLEASIIWGEERRIALKKLHDEISPAHRDAIRRIRGSRGPEGADEYYARLNACAGGEAWCRVFQGSSAQDVEIAMTEHCAKTALKRNDSIVKKLQKAGVVQVIENTFAETPDGFNGTFVVMTDQGQKTVTIKTVYSGGYNIQCLHLRVLVKVK